MIELQSSEYQFLLHTSRKHLSDIDVSAALQLYKQGLNPEALKEQADKNRLYPILWNNLKTLGIEKDPIFSPLKKLTNDYAITSMKLIRELCQIMNCLEENGIHALLLKGPILAQLIYGNVALRPSRDLDILVSEADFEKAFDFLQANGYKNIYGLNTAKRKNYFFSHRHVHHVELKKGDLLCELHWRPDNYSGCSFEELIARDNSITMCGMKFHIPDMVPYLYYLMCHGASHSYYRLRWLLDVYELLFSDICPDLTELYGFFAKKNTRFIFLFTMLYLERIGFLQIKKESDLAEVISKQVVNAGENSILIPIAEDDKNEWDIAEKLLDAAWNYRIASDTETEQQAAIYLHLFEDILSDRGLGDYRKLSDRFHITVNEFQRYDLPDSLFLLYYILRPVDWIRRKLHTSGENYRPRTFREVFRILKRQN